MAIPKDLPRRVLVVGAGTMGRQVALQCALFGLEVAVYDISATQLDTLAAWVEQRLREFITAGWVEAERAHQAANRIRRTTDAVLHGAAGCHFYGDEIGKLAEKIRRVAEGEVACSVEILQMAIRGEHGNRLTYRERQVLCLVSQGLRNKEIAKALGISVYTVKNHVHSLFRKLGAKRRYELSQSLVGRSKGGGAEAG